MCFSLDCHRWRLEMHRGHTDRSVCAWKEGGFITECIIWECFLSEGQMPCEYEWYLIHAEGTHPGGGDHDSVSLQNEKKKVPMNEKKSSDNTDRWEYITFFCWDDLFFGGRRSREMLLSAASPSR